MRFQFHHWREGRKPPENVESRCNNNNAILWRAIWWACLLRRHSNDWLTLSWVVIQLKEWSLRRVLRRWYSTRLRRFHCPPHWLVADPLLCPQPGMRRQRRRCWWQRRSPLMIEDDLVRGGVRTRWGRCWAWGVSNGCGSLFMRAATTLKSSKLNVVGLHRGLTPFSSSTERGIYLLMYNKNISAMYEYCGRVNNKVIFDHYTKA